MSPYLVNWRTTAAGAAAILGALADICSQIAAAHADPNRLWADVTALAIGAGLVNARDQGTRP